MKAGTGVLLALLALSACGDEDRTQTGYTASNDRTSTSGDDTTAVPAPVVPGVADTLPDPLPPQDTVVVALAPLADSRVRGSGQMGAVGASTAVSVTLSGGSPGITYEGAIRQGACTRMGSTLASLVPVSVDTLGNGRAAGDVAIPLDSLLGGPHVLVYGRSGRPESCAPIGRGAAPKPAKPAAPDTMKSDTTRRKRG
ncbi:MAG: hypothetical protein JO040_06575 [Gemmatimonadetes bacterium]|nr:hypothetical protein [Gemmatimonadota bacterium]